MPVLPELFKRYQIALRQEWEAEVVWKRCVDNRLSIEEQISLSPVPIDPKDQVYSAPALTPKTRRTGEHALPSRIIGKMRESPTQIATAKTVLQWFPSEKALNVNDTFRRLVIQGMVERKSRGQFMITPKGLAG